MHQLARFVHLNLFGPQPVVVFGTDEQKRRMLPPLIAGTDRACFGVTEPGVGSDTTRVRTFARRDGDRYIVNGQKVWTSTAQHANEILPVARTAPIQDCARPMEGVTLFYTDLDRSRVRVSEIEKMARKAVDSNELAIEGLEIPVDDRIGEEGQGFKYLLHGLNPEPILFVVRELHFRLSISIQRDSLEMAGPCACAAARSVFPTRPTLRAGGKGIPVRFDFGGGQCRGCEDPRAAFQQVVSVHGVLPSLQAGETFEFMLNRIKHLAGFTTAS